MVKCVIKAVISLCLIVCYCKVDVIRTVSLTEWGLQRPTLNHKSRPAGSDKGNNYYKSVLSLLFLCKYTFSDFLL